MDAREQKGLEIAARARIEKRGETWLVPSQSSKGTYRVTMDDTGPRCTCPDFELRGVRCKHGYAVEIVMQRETVTETSPDGSSQATVTETAAVRVTYPQNWPAYNQAQTQEKALFCGLLRDLAVSVPEPEQRRGRPRIPIADAIFCGGFKVYSTVSSRRFMTDLREAHTAGLVSKPWHFNSVLNCIDDETLTPVLNDLVTASAASLRSVESTFAVDSTGFGVQQYYRPFTAKYGGQELESRDWLKLDAIVGTKTNVIAAASVTDRNANDSPQFAPLMQVASQNFDIQPWRRIELMARASTWRWPRTLARAPTSPCAPTLAGSIPAVQAGAWIAPRGAGSGTCTTFAVTTSWQSTMPGATSSPPLAP